MAADRNRGICKVRRLNVLKQICSWVNERVEIHDVIKKEILDKPVPRGLNLSFCFGGITFFLFLLLAATGYFMTIYYVPHPEQAYGAVNFMSYEISMGRVIRGVHFWSANLMIVTMFLHMIRVFIYGAYKKPRELNWMTGVLLLLLVLAFAFTGHLLPWDQKGYWATKVGTSMIESVPVAGKYALPVLRGGKDIGALTLVRFYSLHVIFLPTITICLLIGHFFMIRKQGVSAQL